MIPRDSLLGKLQAALGRSLVVTILGPRQCGKTTLARMMGEPRTIDRFDLENPLDRSRLGNPLLALSRLDGLVIIDEVQRMPELLPIIRVLVDRPERRASFLLLGSASPTIVKGVSESLAGRCAFLDMAGFDLLETGRDSMETLWFRGSFPLSFLALNDGMSAAWRYDFIRTFLERDVPQLGISIPAATLGRFWTMVAHYHGNVWNAAEFARSLGSSEGTARRYLDVVTGAFVVRQLQPWFENLSKRQVKSPKIYIKDSGLLHSLLGLDDASRFPGHVKYGASWEGFAVEQLLSVAGTREAWYWSTYSGAELDLMLLRNGKRIGYEMKCTDAPVYTKSMAVASRDLGLEALYVVYPGSVRYPISDRAEAVPLWDAMTDLQR